VERRPLFVAVTIAGTLAAIGALVWWAQPYLDPVQVGQHVNANAWQASYRERGLTPPPGGPRDGYWQADLPKRLPDAEIGWAERELELPGRISIDANGWQHYRSRHPDHKTIAILGGSVALGAYASSDETVYFHRLGRRLDSDPRTAADIVIIASIAWKSSQEVAALARRTDSLDLDWVIALDGLNDVTNGSTAESLYSQKSETRDGSPWTLEYHAHDFLERAVAYSKNIAAMHAVAAERNARMMVVLQPALFEREPMTPIEADLFRRVRDRFASIGHLRETYAAMRKGLSLIADKTDLEVLDASRLFAGEPETTFTDLWHFADPGHELLADAIADRLAPLLLEQATEEDDGDPQGAAPRG